MLARVRAFSSQGGIIMTIKKYKENRRPSANVELVIGDCGAGKSAYATTMALKYIKKGYKVFSNIPLIGAYKIDIDDFGNYELPDKSVIIFDEAATYGLASRGSSYKDSNKPNVITFFTMYRHFKVEKMFIISPSFQDVIPIVRSRINKITVVKKSIFNMFGFGCTKSITKTLDICSSGATTGGEPREVYKWKILSLRYHYRKRAFAKYDSYSNESYSKLKLAKW